MWSIMVGSKCDQSWYDLSVIDSDSINVIDRGTIYVIDRDTIMCDSSW
jgi:hypothetical protein